MFVGSNSVTKVHIGDKVGVDFNYYFPCAMGGSCGDTPRWIFLTHLCILFYKCGSVFP